MGGKKRKRDIKSLELDTSSFQTGPEVVIANFTNGRLLNEDIINKVEYFTTEDQANTKKFKKRILVTETDRLQYAGANFGPYCARYQAYCEYYIGALNKNTGKMRLINCELYKLKPTITGSLFGIDTVDEKKPQDKPKFQEQRDELTMSFGSLKKQRVVESRIRHKVGQSDLEEVISNTVKNVQVEATPIQGTNENSLNEIIPPINRNAVTVEDVYKVSDLISEDDQAILNELALAMSSASVSEVKTWTVEEKYSKFIMQCFRSLPSGEARVNNCKLLIYMQFLVYILQLKGDDFKKKDPLPDEVPVLMKKKLIATYLQKSGRSGGFSFTKLTPKSKDKLMAHIIVLALLVTNFKFNAEALIADFKTNSQKFQVLVKAVGAKYQKGSGRSAKATVTLSLPLVVAEARVYSRRKTK